MSLEYKQTNCIWKLNHYFTGINNPNLKYIEACLRCLRTIFTHKGAPVYQVYQVSKDFYYGIIARRNSLSWHGEQEKCYYMVKVKIARNNCLLFHGQQCKETLLVSSHQHCKEKLLMETHHGKERFVCGDICPLRMHSRLLWRAIC